MRLKEMIERRKKLLMKLYKNNLTYFEQDFKKKEEQKHDIIKGYHILF